MSTLKKRNKIKKKSNKKKIKLGGVNPEKMERNANKVFKVFNILNQRASVGEFDDLSTSNLGRLARTRNVNRRQARNKITTVVLKDNIQNLMEQAASAESGFVIRIDGEEFIVDTQSYVYNDIVIVNLYINWTLDNRFIPQYIGSFNHPDGVYTGLKLVPDEEFRNFVRNLLENNGEIQYLDNITEIVYYNTHRR